MSETIRKLSNFKFQWTITLHKDNLNNIAFFFYIFLRPIDVIISYL